MSKTYDAQIMREVLSRMGSMRALARALGISHVSVRRWVKVPPLRVLEIERLTGISRYKLRPDIFGKAPDHKDAA